MVECDVFEQPMRQVNFRSRFKKKVIQDLLILWAYREKGDVKMCSSLHEWVKMLVMLNMYCSFKASKSSCIHHAGT
ncbi:hypothetical protein IQ07DRAFT_409232 [Pyrenochaeta sp. DS3sAY3a]|nr:hypothetical protein IQ07DRAFT_409232 [Pyrenochaeta sp. DS3sAY3a]